MCYKNECALPFFKTALEQVLAAGQVPSIKEKNAAGILKDTIATIPQDIQNAHKFKCRIANARENYPDQEYYVVVYDYVLDKISVRRITQLNGKVYFAADESIGETKQNLLNALVLTEEALWPSNKEPEKKQFLMAPPRKKPGPKPKKKASTE